MAVPKSVSVQNDFSAGVIDVSAKRGDTDKTLRAGLRQCTNFRILDTKKTANRHGRTARFIDGPRVDEVLMSPGNVFELCFSAGKITVRDANGASVFTSTKLGDGATNIPWTANNVNLIVWDTARLVVYLTFPGIVPQVLTWDGVATWTLSTYAETVTPGGQKRTPFYRISPQNITMQPSAVVGNITIKFSSNVLVAGMIGTRMRFCDRQILITGVTNGVLGTATVQEPLPTGQAMNLGSSPINVINLGDEIIGGTSNAKGIVTAIFAGGGTQTLTFASAPFAKFPIGDAVSGGTSGATGQVASVDPERFIILLTGCVGVFTAGGETITGPHGSLASTSATGGVNGLNVQLLPVNGIVTRFLASEGIEAPLGTLASTAVSDTPPQPVSVWDDEVMNSFRGYPQSVFVDQTRLGFCAFPGLPNGIAWSAINLPSDQYPHDASSPDNAIFELAPGKTKVLYVTPGAESSEFVFGDSGIWYIPITPQNPLKPGSVGFNHLSGEGASQVQPRLTGEIVIYVPAGGSTMRAVTATGAYQRPYEVRQISTEHDDLFGTIVALASPGASDPGFPEQYIYVLNADGTIAQAKISVENGQINGELGWSPITSVGAIKWVSSRLGTSTVWFTTTYPTGPVTIAEVLDFTQYLDGALPYNSVPTALTPPGGKGPLWWYAGGSVTLMDQSTRWMGIYQVDANGFLIPQFHGGEDLTRASLVAGQAWTATHERFVPGVQEGPEGQGGPQRMRKRRVARNAVYVQQSSGFLIQSLRNGVPWAQRRIEAYLMGEDATLPPTLREDAYEFRFKGRDHDPRQIIVKDTPGPLIILEHSLEVTA